MRDPSSQRAARSWNPQRRLHKAARVLLFALLLVLRAAVVRAEPFDCISELGFAFVELANLARIMRLDHFLDRGRAGMGRFFAHQRSQSAQPETCDLPNRRHQGWPHTPLGDQAIECAKMLLLTRLHLRKQRSGALLAGDTIQVAQDRHWVSFMYRYPNMIPLNARAVQRIVGSVDPLPFDRIYGG